MATATVDYNTLLEFERITSKSIAQFYQECLLFFANDYNIIVSYYSGEIKEINSAPFANFEALKKERDSFFEVWQNNIKKFTNLKWFLLIESFEEIDSRFNTLDNINKWSRSSLTKVAYDPSFQLNYTLRQRQTLERVSSDVLGSNNPEDDWVDIATSNYLKEEDYSPAGGTNMNLILENVPGYNFKLNSVVDVMNGISVYGKDLDMNFGFDTANNDLKILSPADTIQQAVDILIRLKSNDIPSVRSLGLQSALVVGTNRALLNFPVIIRQLNNTFASDDSLKDFTVTAIGFDQDNLTVTFTVSSRLNDVLGSDNVNI